MVEGESKGWGDGGVDGVGGEVLPVLLWQGNTGKWCSPVHHILPICRPARHNRSVSYRMQQQKHTFGSKRNYNLESHIISKVSLWNFKNKEHL